MEKNIEQRLNRLCDRYVKVEAMVKGLMPPRALNPRQARAHSMSVATLLDILNQERIVPANSLVRLAYVRALRDMRPDAKLGDDEEHEVGALASQLDQQLGQVEWMQMAFFQQHMRRLRLSQSKSTVTGQPLVTRFGEDYPLEHSARACIRNVLAMASTAGTLAGTSAAGYDPVT